MKIKKFLSLMLLVLVAILLVACGESNENPDEKKDDPVVEKTADEIIAEYKDKVGIKYAEGDSATSVTANVTLNKPVFEGLTVEWASDNEAVITAAGVVTRPAAGEADATVKLTATLKYKDATKNVEFTLVVKAEEVVIVSPLAVEITGNDTMQEGAVYTLNAEVKPENATDKTVTWASDNEEVATVDAEGKVTAVKAGTATITATANGNTAVKGTFTVTVVEPSAETIAATYAKAKGETGWCKGVVMCTYKQGYMIYDGTGFILVFTGKDTTFDYVVGDYVEVKGVLDEYQGSRQFTKDAEVKKLEETAPEYKIPTTKLKDAAAVTAFMGAFEFAKKVSVRVTVVSASANYVNCVVKGSEVGVCVTYPADYTQYTVGKDYDIVAYSLYVKNYNNVDSLYVMTEKSTEVDYGFDVKITYKDGETSSEVVINSLEFPVMELEEPEEKEGFVFLGWFKGTEEAPVRVYSIFAPADTELFARWVAEADAPIFVDPESEEEGVAKSISEAVFMAKEGQEIILAPGTYQEDYITPVARTYNTPAELLAAFGADFVSVNQLKAEDKVNPRAVDVSLFETLTAESSWVTTFLSNAEMTAKWSWFYKAIAEIVGNEDMDPETFTPADVRFNFIVNFYGFFTQTQHVETYSKSCVSENWANPALVQAVILAGPKVDETQEDAVASKIIIDKAVKITGPNANVHGHSEDRNEEANITSKFIIAVDNVIIDGVEFSGDAVVQIGSDATDASSKHITIKNSNVHTDVYGKNPTGNNNRQGSIITALYAEDINLIDNSIVFAGSSYTSVAIDFAGNGSGSVTAKDINIIGNYFESTNATAAGFEMIMGYHASGAFNFINNEVRVGIDGYLIRIGYYCTACTEINIIDNDFLGLGDLGGASIGIPNIDSTKGMKINVIGNNFEKLAPATFVFGTAGTTTLGCVFNYYYNYFSAEYAWNITATGSIVINHANNLTLADYHASNVVDIKKDDNTFADKAALDEAYAAYKATLKTITFDSNGGSSVLPMHYAVAADVKLPTPEKYGYEFGGWYDGETKVEKLTEVKDMNLTAKWLGVYYITFDSDGGNKIATIAFSDPAQVELPMNVYKIVESESEEGKKYETVADVAADFVADFKAYAGGNLSDASDIDTGTIDSGSILNMLKDATLTAKWAWLYQALYVAGGSPEGKEYTNPQDVGAYKGFWLANLYGFFNGEAHTDTWLNVTSTDFSNADTTNTVLAAGPKASIYTPYVIDAWYENDAAATITEARNYNLKAHYAEAKTITLVDGEEKSYVYFIDAAKVELPTPSKAGFYFTGWVDAESNPAAVTEVKDYTFNATWRELANLEVVPGTTDPDKFATLAAALAAAHDGDTIVLAAGDYSAEELETITQNDLTIIGAKAYEFSHKDEYTPAAENDSIINKLVVSGKNFTLKNVVMTQVKGDSLEGLTVESVYVVGSVDGAVFLSGTSKDLTVKNFYYAGSGNRVVYQTAGVLTNLTVDTLIIMDAATVTLTADGGFSAGVCDVIRFGMSNTATAAGAVVVKNCYFRAGQSGIMDRVPNADSYTITNCYFKGIPAAIYMRAISGGATKAITYNWTYNTFFECGNSITDWDVIAVTSGANTVAEIHYNVFAYSFKYKGSSMATDYVIKVRTDAGSIDCANNYFVYEDAETYNNLNATGLTALELAEEIQAPEQYDMYKIMVVNKTIRVYGVNYNYAAASVILDGAEPIEAAVGVYQLPTPTQDGKEFQGWVDGEGNPVTSIDEAKTYTLTSTWKDLSVFHNVEGLTGFYATYNEVRAELLKDINTYFGKSFTFDTITYETWTIIQYANMFIQPEYAQKWLPLLKVFVDANSPCSTRIAPLVSMIEANQTEVSGFGWASNSNPYALNYEVVGFVKGLENKKHTSLWSLDWSVAANQDLAVAAYPPVKEGYTFVGWFEDAEFNTPATTIEKYEKNYYAKFEEKAPEPKYDVTLTLNGGNLYASTEAMLAEFIAAYAAHYGLTDVTAANWSDKLETTCGAETWTYDAFFTAHTEWNWFLTFYTALINADTDWVGTGISSKYSWRQAFQAYATATERTSWPYVTATSTLVTRSLDWAAYYDEAATATLSQVEAGYELPTPAKPGYTFEGWFAAEDFSGDAVTTVAGNATLYAKFEAEAPNPYEGKTYQTIDALGADLLNDIQTKLGNTNITADTLTNAEASNGVRNNGWTTFFGDAAMWTKWSWLIDFLKANDTYTGAADAFQALIDAENHAVAESSNTQWFLMRDIQGLLKKTAGTFYFSLNPIDFSDATVVAALLTAGPDAE